MILKKNRVLLFITSISFKFYFTSIKYIISLFI
nr:MAG TPA: hypothetical protein [Caudoviricetes sp.]